MNQTLEQLLSHTEIIDNAISLHGFLCCQLSQPQLAQSSAQQYHTNNSNQANCFSALKSLSKRLAKTELAALEQFAEPIQTQLNSANLNLELPIQLDDTEDLQQSMQQLYDWIDGFLFAFGLYQADADKPLHADIAEWVRDLTEIQRHCQYALEEDPQNSAAKNQQTVLDLLHIEQFIRTGVYLCKTIWQQPKPHLSVETNAND